MTTYESLHPVAGAASTGRLSRFFEGLRKAWYMQTQYLTYHRTISVLSSLSKDQLADLGLTRADIPAAAHRAVWPDAVRHLSAKDR